MTTPNSADQSELFRLEPRRATSSGPLSGNHELDGMAAFESPAPHAATGPGLGSVFIAIWIFGALLCIISLGRSLHAASRMARTGTLLSGTVWRRLLDRYRRYLHMRREVPLKEHPQAKVPVTIGWLKPVVVLPSQARSWSFHRCGSVLIHELSHIKRRDALSSLIGCMACALNWYNPLIWWLWRKMKLYREQACDEIVLSAGIRPSAYARHLLELGGGEQYRRRTMEMAMGMANGFLLRQRLLSILEPNQFKKEKEMNIRKKISWMVVWLLAVSLLGTVQIFTKDGATVGAAAEVLDAGLHTPGSVPYLTSQEKDENTKYDNADEKKKKKRLIQIDGNDCDTVTVEGHTLVLRKDGNPVRRVDLTGVQTVEIRLDSETYRLRILKGKVIMKKENGEGESLLWHGDDHFTIIKGGDIMVVTDKSLIKSEDTGKHVLMMSGDGENQWSIHALEDGRGEISLKEIKGKEKFIVFDGSKGDRHLSMLDLKSEGLTDIYIKEGGDPGEIRIQLLSDGELSKKGRDEISRRTENLRGKVPEYVTIEFASERENLDLTIRLRHGGEEKGDWMRTMKRVNEFVRSLKTVVRNMTMKITLHSDD